MEPHAQNGEVDEPLSQTRMHHWRMPTPFASLTDAFERMYPLRVQNSLTRTKERFIPASPERVLWYQCGPTVYDSSHMGHARTYVTLDILRRIMRDYFGYNVILIQNVTDIDDKIIVRAKQREIPFRKLAQTYEEEFFEDMKLLNVELPDVITRVTEYVPEVVAYVSDLVAKGYAYEANGSVYFDTSAFTRENRHTYGKLMPEQIGNSDLLAEGEGVLSEQVSKQNLSDFALWKKTPLPADGQQSDPWWESPWGRGRPGWHIECSVMATLAVQAYGGTTLDVHAGGVDLRFPHHENEIAQAEAHEDCDQWANYWLHTGHLHIKGSKMSKSLKNFVTIRKALESQTPNQMRMLFLGHKYNAPMDFCDKTIVGANAVDSLFSEFFLNMKVKLRETDLSQIQKVNEPEAELIQSLERARMGVRRALCDDFDTPSALRALQELVNHTNRYINGPAPCVAVMTSIMQYVQKTLETWGCRYSDEGTAASREETLAPILDTICQFRTEVRSAARGPDPMMQVLRVCDSVRDEWLPPLGVRLEDKTVPTEDGGSQLKTVWKLEDPSRRAMAKEVAAQASSESETRKIYRDSSINPLEYFKLKVDEQGVPLYKAYNEEGIPTHNQDGEPINKSQGKKIRKEMERQQAAYAKYLQSKQNGVENEA